MLDQLRRHLNPHHHRHHHFCRQFLLDYHVELLHTHSLHTYFCPVFRFFMSFSSSYAFLLLLIFSLPFVVAQPFRQTATDLSQLSLALEMSTRIPSYLRISVKMVFG